MEAVAHGLDARLGDALTGRLAEAGAAALIVLAESSVEPDMAPFAGSAHVGECFVLVTPSSAPRLAYLTDMERDEARSTALPLLPPDLLGVGELVRSGAGPAELWSRLVERALRECGVEKGDLLVAGRLPAGTVVELVRCLGEDGWTARSGTELIRQWRKYKPPSWRARMERPAAGVRRAMWSIAEALAGSTVVNGSLLLDGEPLRIGRLRELVATEFAALGLSQPEGNILAVGADAGVPHTRGGSSRILGAGEPLVVDLFPKGDLFADCTRTFCVGEPPAGFRRAFDLTRRALETAHDRARPGLRGWDLQAATCDLFEAAGFQTLRTDPAARTGYVHGLGHGVGFELHEYPSFRESAGDEGLLEAGDLLTLEPGLYDAEAGYGVRLEDLCYLGSEGLVNLTPLPVDWDPAAWVRGPEDGV